MAGPIYMLLLGKGYTEAWHQLSQDERDDLWSKVEQIDARAGGKPVLLCDSRWADEAVAGWGVIEYPDFDAYLQKVAELEQLEWWRYFEAKTILGTRMEETVSST